MQIFLIYINFISEIFLINDKNDNTIIKTKSNIETDR